MGLQNGQCRACSFKLFFSITHQLFVGCTFVELVLVHNIRAIFFRRNQFESVRKVCLHREQKTLEINEGLDGIRVHRENSAARRSSRTTRYNLIIVMLLYDTRPTKRIHRSAFDFGMMTFLDVETIENIANFFHVVICNHLSFRLSRFHTHSPKR